MNLSKSVINKSSLNEHYSSDLGRKISCDENEPRPGSKNLSPRMKVLVRDHIENSIMEMQAELENFVLFVEEIQKQVPSEWEMVTVSPLQSPSEQGSSGSSNLPPLRQPIPVNSRPRNAALRDAFHIVKKLLLRAVKLITEIAMHASLEDEAGLEAESPYFDLYYAQYVFQLAFFVLRIISQQLIQFSETIGQEITGRSLGTAASAEEKIGIDSFPSFSFVHKKDHVICPEQEGENTCVDTLKNQPISNNKKNFFQDSITYVATDREFPTTVDYGERVLSALSDTSSTNLDLRCRISDALELLIFLSEKMLYWLQESGLAEYKLINYIKPKLLADKCGVCPDCTVTLSRAESGLCNSCRTLLRCNQVKEPDFTERNASCVVNQDSAGTGSQQFQPQQVFGKDKSKKGILKPNSSENFFSSLASERILRKEIFLPHDLFEVKRLGEIRRIADEKHVKLSAEDCIDHTARPRIRSSTGCENNHVNVMERKERISIVGIFNINTFSKRLKEELGRYLCRSASQVPMKFEQYEASSIMSIVEKSFKDASVKGDVDIKRDLIAQSSPEESRKETWALLKGEDAYSLEKDTRTDIPSLLEPSDKTLDEAVRRFAEEALRIAVQNVERKRQARKTVAEKKLIPVDKEADKLAEPIPVERVRLRIPPKQPQPATKTRTKSTEPRVKALPKSVPSLEVLPKSSETKAETFLRQHRPCSEPLQKPPKQTITPEAFESHETAVKEFSGMRVCKHDVFVKGCTSCAYQEKFLLSDFYSSESMMQPQDCFPISRLQWRESQMLLPHQDLHCQGMAEVREINASDEVEVTVVELQDNQEPQDERWERNILHNMAHVKVSQPTVEDKKPYLGVRYDSHKRAPRASMGETQLSIIKEVAAKYSPSSKEFDDRQKHTSLESFTVEEEKDDKKRRSLKDISSTRLKFATESKIKQNSRKKDFSKRAVKFDVINKLSRLYDDLRKNEMCVGPPLVLKVREDSLLKDAFDLLMAPSTVPLNYYRYIKAYITYGSTSVVTNEKVDFSEEDQTEEFYEFLTEKLFSPDYRSLFHYQSLESEFLYPNPGSHSAPEWFEFAGVILALSILHQNPVKIKFPLCFFKCLLDRPLRLDDLGELDPLLHHKLIWMKENDVSERKKPIPFSVKDRLGNESVENYLGDVEDLVVTEDNKYQFIEACLKWRLAENCLEQMKEIRNGFVSVLDPSLLSDFSEEELQQLCSKPLDEISSSEDVPLNSASSSL